MLYMFCDVKILKMEEENYDLYSEKERVND